MVVQSNQMVLKDISLNSVEVEAHREEHSLTFSHSSSGLQGSELTHEPILTTCQTQLDKNWEQPNYLNPIHGEYYLIFKPKSEFLPYQHGKIKMTIEDSRKLFSSQN